MIAIRIGTRTEIEGRLIGASNLDIGEYQLEDGTRITGPTVLLSFPDAPALTVGTGQSVTIGGRVHDVEGIDVGDSPEDSAVRLLPRPAETAPLA